ncbi:AtzE family amidohydrolase, partial [Planktothrix sp. FACHB-1355]
MIQAYPDAIQIASVVREQEVSAKSIVAAALSRIADGNQRLNCFTTVMADSALADAEAIDRQIAEGKDPGILAGVPIAVKDLLDIAGITTLAGS